jgi:hypothetical protein
MRKPDIELSWAHPRAWLAEESDSSRSFLGIAIVAGFLQICTARFLPSSDGNSYLETATANLNGDWKNELNALWSPFFSWSSRSRRFILALSSQSPA